MLAPVAGLVEIADRLAEAQAVGKTQGVEALQALLHRARAVRPVPDEQADVGGLFIVEAVPRQQPGDPAARSQAAGLGLHMRGQAPIEFALQGQVKRRRQVLRDRRQASRPGRPVLTVAAVPPADGLLQMAGTVDQGHRHAIDLGLDPQVFAGRHPVAHRGVIRQLVQSGLCHRVGNAPGAAAQGIGGRRADSGKAAAPLLQLGARLIVELVGYQRHALAMVGLIPGGDLCAECGYFLRGLRLRPVGAGGGPGIEGDNDEKQKREPGFHHEHPCPGNRLYSLAGR
ncbi:hypothetical protein FQZ97_920700 [compost metagenome]